MLFKLIFQLMTTTKVKKMQVNLEENLLIIAVVQTQDAEAAEAAMLDLGFSVNKLPSVGGFLGRKNATLMVGLPYRKMKEAVKSLHDNCRQRIEYIAVPLDSAPLPMPTPTPVTIGGATIFSIQVDCYEEI